MNALEQAFPQATVELWTTDQHRVGLKPILRTRLGAQRVSPTRKSGISATNGSTYMLDIINVPFHRGS